MTTNYPISLDVYADKIDNISTVLASSVNNLQDAVAALQTHIGKDSSAVVTTIDYMVGDFFDIGVRQCYFWMATAPVGWTTIALASECAVVVKGGVASYNIDGGQYFDPFQPGGSSGAEWTINDQMPGAHRHRWYQGGLVTPSMYDQPSGDPLIFNSGAEVSGIMHNVQKGKDRKDTYDSGYYTDTDYHTHSFLGAWRPTAAVGLLAQYTGA
jgi:hypothetical protein